MKPLKNLTGDSLEQLIDYQVVDQNGDEIGSLHSLWSEPDTGAVEFLGVKTGWLFGQNHVVPAEKAELDETESVVRLPYTAMFIKEAPAISADAEISEAEEASIYQYYGLDRTGPSIETAIPPTPAASVDDAARWRRIKSSLLNDAESGKVVDQNKNDVGKALDDMVVGDTSGTHTASAALPESYGTTNLYGSTGDTTPVAEDSAGEKI